MRKYFLSASLILIGLAVIVYGLTQKSSNVIYAENAFAKEAKAFDQIFVDFIDRVETHILRTEDFFDAPGVLNDSTKTMSFLIQQLDDLEYLESIGFFQGIHKAVARKDGDSRIFAHDSTDTLDVVKWKRYEKNKLISTWNESLDRTIESAKWYQQLSKRNGEMTWFKQNRNDPDNLSDRDFVYCGYGFQQGDQQGIILLEFDTEVLSLNFLDDGMPKDGRFFVQTTDKRILDFNESQKKEETDSLNMALERHFGRFSQDSIGTFKFDFKKETYWNAFHKLESKTGIDHYLMTVNGKELASFAAAKNSRTGLLMGSGILILGLVLLLVRKRFFYRPNQMKIDGVEEILKTEESRYLEFKSSLRWDYRQEKVNPDLEKVILKTLAAFGNTDGGILLIGVDDDKNILGLENDFNSLKKKDADYFEVHMRNLLHKELGVKYVSQNVRTQFETIDGKVVCKIRIIHGDEPIYLKVRDKNGNQSEKFYVRSGNSSHEIKSIAEINDYITKKFRK